MSRLFWIAIAIIGGGVILLIANDDAGQTFGIENDAFGRTLYLSVWVLVVGAGILASGMRLGSVARNLAIWLLVMLVLVAGYQYRYELQDITSRLTAGLVPGSPVSLVDSEGRETVLLEKAGNGHFELRATVDGASVRFIVDTGATATVLTTEDASAIGIDLSSLAYTVPVQTANGTAMAARATVEAIRIGNIVRERMPVLVAERDRLGRSLLGMNFLETLSGFDVRGDRLILRD